MPFLIERFDGTQPAASRVEGNALRIGRGTNADLRLDDPAVALEHARIEHDLGRYRLLDLGSVTGTYLNGKPVESAYLQDGDVIGIGGSRLRVRLSPPDGPPALEVRPAVAEAAAEPAAVKTPEVDYVGAYSLRRPFLSKGLLAAIFTLAAVGVLAALPLKEMWHAFQPGATSDAHQRKQVGCFDCHAPWKGPATENCSSAECHPRANHQPRQASTPDCSDCHFEHRGEKKLIFVSDASCVSCHGDLKVKRGEPAFARKITDFPDGHADFSLTLRGGARLPIAEAVARRADPGTVRLDHARHLKPGLIGPEGREALACASCHTPGPGPTGMRPVEYERHCQRCHRLTFDSARPDTEALHDEPRKVHGDLVAVYLVDERRMGTFRERRRRVVRDPEAETGVTANARVRAQVAEAESHLYRSACVKCHPMELDARPFPTVAPAAIHGEWLPHSRFSHSSHVSIKGLTCETCHPRAVASHLTGDVLLPGLEVCGGCHGGGRLPGAAELRAGPDECTECHTYHPRKKEGKG